LHGRAALEHALGDPRPRNTSDRGFVDNATVLPPAQIQIFADEPVTKLLPLFRRQISMHTDMVLPIGCAAYSCGLHAYPDLPIAGLISRANDDLANDLGNLVRRVMPLVRRYRDGQGTRRGCSFHAAP
jgi:hypothetical protein